MTVQQIPESSHKVLARVFADLAGQLRRETSHFSDDGRVLSHPMHRALVALGYGVVPFMLEELKGDNPVHWFHALHEITGDDPVKREDWGKIKKMAGAWLAWGRQHRYTT